MPITSEQMQQLIQVAQTENVVDLTRHNIYHIGDDGMSSLVNMLRSVPYITDLNLNSTATRNSQIDLLAEVLPELTHLTSLRLGHNAYEAGADAPNHFEDMSSLGVALGQMPSLIRIDLSSNLLCYAGSSLFNQVKRLGSLIELNLRGNQHFDLGSLLSLVSRDGMLQLKTLNLGFCRMENAQIVELAEHLRYLPNLTVLDLTDSLFEPCSIKALQDKLLAVQKLEVLMLDSADNTCTYEEGVAKLELLKSDYSNIQRCSLYQGESFFNPEEMRLWCGLNQMPEMQMAKLVKRGEFIDNCSMQDRDFHFKVLKSLNMLDGDLSKLSKAFLGSLFPYIQDIGLCVLSFCAPKELANLLVTCKHFEIQFTQVASVADSHDTEVLGSDVYFEI
jgi:hypothetical protein